MASLANTHQLPPRITFQMLPDHKFFPWPRLRRDPKAGCSQSPQNCAGKTWDSIESRCLCGGPMGQTEHQSSKNLARLVRLVRSQKTWNQIFFVSHSKETRLLREMSGVGNTQEVPEASSPTRKQRLSKTTNVNWKKLLLAKVGQFEHQ